jgi:fucose permease
VAWPSLRAYFHVPIDALGLLTLAAMPGYLTAGFFSGRILKKFTTPALLAASFMLTGLALLFFTVSPSFYLIAAAVLFSGFGAGLIDAGINLYVTRNLSKRQMQWLHACWGIGITAGPLIMTACLASAHSWKPGYLAAGGLQLALAAGFALTIKAWGNRPAEEQDNGKTQTTAVTATLSSLKVWRSMGLFFFYTGIESVLGLWSYTLLTESRGVAPAAAGVLTGSYWAIFTASRISAGFYTKFIRPQLLVLSCMSSGLLGVIFLWSNISQALSLSGVVLTGFSIAPVFPSLMSDTKARVGPEHEWNSVGMQMSAAALGSTSMPAIAGVLVRNFTLEAIPIFLLMLFIVVIGIFMTFFTGKFTGRMDKTVPGEGI